MTTDNIDVIVGSMDNHRIIEKSRYVRELDGLTAYAYRIEDGGRVQAGYNYQTGAARDAALSRALESMRPRIPMVNRGNYGS